MMLSFGQRLKEIRKNAQITQAELAERLMVSVQAVSKWECDSSMPDISQIVPLAAVLGVTTDCLLGVGGDEKADREKLYDEVKRINKGIEKVYDRKDNAYHECYELYREHIKKYPLDYEVKFLCADSLVRVLYYGQDAEKDKLYYEAVNLLKSVINCDRDTSRIIDAKQTLVILYLYNNDFANAEAIAESLPQRGSIRAAMEIEIYSKKNDHDKCIEISRDVCNEAVHHYLWAMAVRARRISLLGAEHKRDAIAAWIDLLDGVRFNYRIFGDIKINTKWMYSALNNLANDYIAVSEIDEALDAIEELAEMLVRDHKACSKAGDYASADEIKKNFGFYLRSCYDQSFKTDDNIISNDPRFKRCEQMIAAVE